jgi:hypothetical protein
MMRPNIPIARRTEMKFPEAVIALFFAIIFPVCLSAQTMPDGFIFDNADKFLYHVRIDHELIPKQVEEYGSYQALGLATEVLADVFAIVLVNAQPEKGALVFKKQKKDPIAIIVDGEKIMGGSFRMFDSKKVGKAQYEAIVVQITREDFEKIIAANKLYIEFGKFTHLASAENLKAFRYLSDRLEKDELPEGASTNGGSAPVTNIQVRGYYRKDGTYVKPHTRKRPRN